MEHWTAYRLQQRARSWQEPQPLVAEDRSRLQSASAGSDRESCRVRAHDQQKPPRRKLGNHISERPREDARQRAPAPSLQAGPQRGMRAARAVRARKLRLSIGGKHLLSELEQHIKDLLGRRGASMPEKAIP